MRVTVTFSLLILLIFVAVSRALDGSESTRDAYRVAELKHRALRSASAKAGASASSGLNCKNCRCKNGVRGWFTRSDCDYCCSVLAEFQAYVAPAKPTRIITV